MAQGVLSFDLNTTTLEQISKGIAGVYKSTDLAKYPMFRWVQILHDATILGEDIRRNRPEKAIQRSGRVLIRLLDFIGHYLFVHDPQKGHPELPDIVSIALKRRSYKNLFANPGPEEGPTRWILAKYPGACAKCGRKPCECIVNPWIFEERREKPGPYSPYRTHTERLRRGLKKQTIKPFTLPGMVGFFQGIYRNSYYHQDPWKLAMHLTEELGEATYELSRLELAWLGTNRIDPRNHLNDILDEAENWINEEIARIEDSADQAAFRRRAKHDIRKLINQLKVGKPFNVFIDIVSERFKEEIADIFSWLTAVISKLSNDDNTVRDNLDHITKRYVKRKGHRKVFRCPVCDELGCTNLCLITHGVSEELVEKVLKF